VNIFVSDKQETILSARECQIQWIKNK